MRWIFRVKVVLWSLWLAQAVQQPTTKVCVSGGCLRGSVAPDGPYSYVQYLGVPYATYTGRFQAPGPEPSWEGILDANDALIQCKQRTNSGIQSGTEDCLILNVLTPIEQSPSPRPVMVSIHGGSFRRGSGSPATYGPGYFIKKDVIVVTFNYRVDIFGFLCLGIDEAPGNAGMKDQVAALKWVKRNIKAFGGDPDNITIFGESAGSASVMYHLLSPMSRGLFHKAIMESASISPWSFQYEPLETASRLALQMGHNTSDPYEIYKIFMNKTAEELLLKRVPRKDGDIYLSEITFVPCVENQLNGGVEPFLTDIPYKIISEGLFFNAPLIIGFNNEEGYYFSSLENVTTIPKLNFYDAMPRDLTFHTDDEKKKTAETLKQLYMGDEPIDISTLILFSRYIGDSQIIYPVVAAADLIAKSSVKPLWLYRFDYSGLLNISKMMSGYGAAPGATHIDELFYLLKYATVSLQESAERDMIEKMTTMWTNFAKYGDPTPQGTSSLPKWEAVDKSDPRLLVIDKQFSTAPLWADDALRFWNATYTQYRRKDVSAF